VSFIGLWKPGRGKKIKRVWGIKVVEAIDFLYYNMPVGYGGVLRSDLIPDRDLFYRIGRPDARIREIHAGTAYFDRVCISSGQVISAVDLDQHRNAVPIDHPDGSITDAKIANVSRVKIYDLWSAPFWDNIPDKPDKFPPEPHGSSHNIGGTDEIPDLATLRSDFDSHRVSTTDHVPSGKYICATSRSDQLPSWDDIPDKPSAFPPEEHTHTRSDITDFWSSPFWENIPDKPSVFPPESHGSSHNIGGTDEIPDLATLRNDFDSHKVSTTDHVPSGKYICSTSRSDQLPSWNDIPDKPSAFPPEEHTHTRSDITDFWSSPFWDNIPDKPSAFPPEPHGSSHNIGGSDEIPDLATLRNDFDSHESSRTAHVPSGKYVCATSRSDQLPSWNDIPDKPSAFPPEAHTHSRSEITDFWSEPFWDNIPDKPSAFPPESHTHTRSDITDFWATPFWNNIPDKPSTFPPSAHASSHKPGGSDALFPANFHINPASDNTYDLGTTSLRWRNIRAVNIYASNIVQVGDLVFKNGWRISEHEEYGLVLVSPDGKMYKIQLEEVGSDENRV